MLYNVEYFFSSLVYWAYYYQICRRKNVFLRVIKQGLEKL